MRRSAALGQERPRCRRRVHASLSAQDLRHAVVVEPGGPAAGAGHDGGVAGDRQPVCREPPCAMGASGLVGPWRGGGLEVHTALGGLEDGAQHSGKARTPGAELTARLRPALPGCASTRPGATAFWYCPAATRPVSFCTAQYRTLRNYRSMEYLGPRMFDKVRMASGHGSGLLMGYCRTPAPCLTPLSERAVHPSPLSRLVPPCPALPSLPGIWRGVPASRRQPRGGRGSSAGAFKRSGVA